MRQQDVEPLDVRPQAGLRWVRAQARSSTKWKRARTPPGAERAAMRSTESKSPSRALRGPSGKWSCPELVGT